MGRDVLLVQVQRVEQPVQRVLELVGIALVIVEINPVDVIDGGRNLPFVNLFQDNRQEALVICDRVIEFVQAIFRGKVIGGKDRDEGIGPFNSLLNIDGKVLAARQNVFPIDPYGSLAGGQGIV